MRLQDISSSQLRFIVDIISHEDVKDADGIPVKVERVVAQKRARVDVPSLRRQETMTALGISASKSLMFIIRYFDGLDSDIHKIRYNNKVYEIQGIEDVGERHLYHNILGVIKD